MHMRKRVQALALVALCGAASAGLTIGSRVEAVNAASHEPAVGTRGGRDFAREVSVCLRKPCAGWR